MRVPVLVVTNTNGDIGKNKRISNGRLSQKLRPVVGMEGKRVKWTARQRSDNTIQGGAGSSIDLV